MAMSSDRIKWRKGILRNLALFQVKDSHFGNDSQSLVVNKAVMLNTSNSQLGHDDSPTTGWMCFVICDCPVLNNRAFE
jgi:hypothetical protein